MASMIASPYDVPGTMSRGAIQHRMPADSSRAQAASATILSFDAWLINTSNGMEKSLMSYESLSYPMRTAVRRWNRARTWDVALRVFRLPVVFLMRCGACPHMNLLCVIDEAVF